MRTTVLVPKGEERTMVPVAPNLNEVVKSLLSKCTHLNHIKQLQSFLTILGYAHTNFYTFKLLRFCFLNLSNLTYARLIFDHHPFPNIYLYTTMITAYASLPDHDSAFSLYRHMLRNGHPTPNHFIFPHVLKSSQRTRLVHTHIQKSGFDAYPVVKTALIDSYSRSRDGIAVARELFDEMPERNVVSWTAMISGYTRVGEIGNAVSLFEEMPDRDVPSWNSVISGCAQNGFFKEAIAVFRKMVLLAQQPEHGDNRPNQVTIVCALSACGHTGMLQLGKWIHGYAYRNWLGNDVFVSNALVDMYGKCGSLKQARRVFQITSKKRLTAWNSMINSYALHGESDRAIGVFEEMRRSGDVKPDDVTFVGLLNACTHGGLVEKGRFYFRLMTAEYGIEPQIQHYGCLIDVLCRAGRLGEALEVVRDMEIEPDEVVWGSLLNGCKIHGRADLAEFAIQKLVEIEPDNGGYGVMLANLYVELGRWDEARQVRKMLQEQDASKTPGCSWIEVDNHVHQFNSVDKSHPKSEEIYTMLQTLACFI